MPLLPNKIKALLIEKGIKQKTIAEKLKVTPGTISRVVNGHSASKSIREYIAKQLHLSYKSVWGKAVQ